MKKIQSAANAYDYAKQFALEDEKRQRFILIYMNEDKIVLGWNERGENQAMINVQNVAGATGAIIVTNHPSGSCLPDKYDIQETVSVRELLRAKGLGLIDQIIVGYKEFFSYAEEKITFINR